MDLENKLAIINQSIQGLKQTQTEMRHRLTSDIAESSESVIADVGKLSDHVYRLEVQFSKHYSKLKEVTKLVLILLDKITIIGSVVENISCVSNKANNDEYEEISVKNKNGTISNTVPSQNKRYGLGATDDNTQSYGANGSNDASVLENKGGMNKSEYKKEISATVSERNIKDGVVNDRKRNDKEIKEESITTEIQHNLLGNNATNSSPNTKKTNTSTEMEIPPQNLQNQTVLTETVRKNAFGYKQKRSDMKSDNRAEFHSNRTPYHRHTVETTTEQNVKSEKTQSPSASSASFGDTGDNHYVASSDDFVPPQDIHGWLEYAHQITCHSHLRLQSGKIKRGRHGHDVILVLDTTERMKGSFVELKQAALKYVDGIQQVSESRRLEDNIGLAVFGRETRLVHESTSDYELIKIFINQLRPEGESPLLSGTKTRRRITIA